MMEYQYKSFLNLLFTLLLLHLQFSSSQQQESCTLPDGNQSTCKRLHNCEYFRSILREHNGRPPQDVVQSIKALHCPTNGYVCCPENSSRQVRSPNNSDHVVNPPNFDTLKSHPNFDLINDRACGISPSNRLIGSNKAQLNEFPWSVLLGYKQEGEIIWRCGGSLINKQFVITAATCLTRELEVVRLGEHTISTTEDCDGFDHCADPVQDMAIEKMIKHPDYSKVKHLNNIAILKLKNPVDLTKNNVKTICLPTSLESDLETIMSTPRILTVTGWGKTAVNEKLSDVAKKAFIPYVENSKCAEIFSEVNLKIHPTILCAGGNNITGTCQGDSGQGIFTYAKINDRPKITLYGITSAGVGCGSQFPEIFTNIRYYLDWILDNMS